MTDTTTTDTGTPSGRPAIFHVGAGKCGSSSLQATLSRQPAIGTAPDGSAYEYVVVNHERGVVRGEAITRLARRNRFGYSNASGLAHFAKDPVQLDAIAGEIRRIGEEGAIPVLSNEAWYIQGDAFAASRFFETVGGVEVVIYVRPQVGWLNSAWWQWGAWSKHGFEDWHKFHLNSLNWSARAREWSALPGVARVTVRLATRDVVADFARVLGVPPLEAVRANLSLDGAVLRLFQQMRDLRPGSQSSAIDFAIGRSIERSSRPPVPWVIPPDQVEALIQRYARGNKALAAMLDEVSRAEFLADPHWWDPAAYADRELESSDPQPLSVEAMRDLAADAIRAVVRLDAELRRKG